MKALPRFSGPVLVVLFASCSFCPPTFCAETLEVVRVDVHERLYPDRWPRPAEPGAVSVPRGTPATFQFAVRTQAKGIARLDFTCDIAGRSRLHWLQAVHVEGNSQGSLKNRPGGEVPKGWMNHLVRAAPFDTLEVLVEGNRMPIVAGRTNGAVLEFTVPRDTKPGTYEGELRGARGGDRRPIVVTGDDCTIRNETEYRIVLQPSAGGNTVVSFGPVTDLGTDNTVSRMGQSTSMEG